RLCRQPHIGAAGPRSERRAHPCRRGVLPDPQPRRAGALSAETADGLRSGTKATKHTKITKNFLFRNPKRSLGVFVCVVVFVPERSRRPWAVALGRRDPGDAEKD